MSSLADFEARIAALHQSVEAELLERVRVFDGADLETIRREAHKIRGGFPNRKRLTLLAGQAEELAASGDEDGARRAVEALVEEATRISLRATPPKDPSIAPEPQSGPRILVVDDDEAIRRMVVMSLSRLGKYNVDEMDDGVGVVDRLSAQTYDLVIVDAMMPGMGGVELALDLRERARLSGVKVVVLSAAAPDELGADGHDLVWWRKPIAPKELVERVKAIVDR